MQSCARNLSAILRHRSVFRTAKVRCAFSKITSPASRKSKKSAAHEIEEPDEYEIEYNFDVEVRKTIQKVHDAVLPMKKSNVGFDVTLDMGDSEPSLTIITARGKIDFTVDYPRRILNLKSFMSGIHFYAFDPEEAVWLSTKASIPENCSNCDVLHNIRLLLDCLFVMCAH